MALEYNTRQKLFLKQYELMNDVHHNESHKLHEMYTSSLGMQRWTSKILLKPFLIQISDCQEMEIERFNVDRKRIHISTTRSFLIV